MKTDIQAKNFTMCLDNITQRFDLLTSAVYGRMWRYSQMNDGVCRAARGRIAEDLNVSVNTVAAKQQVLAADGLIEDMTPNLRNHPHTFRVANMTLVSALEFVPAYDENEVDDTNMFDEFEDFTLLNSEQSLLKFDAPATQNLGMKKEKQIKETSSSDELTPAQKWAKKVADTKASGEDLITGWMSLGVGAQETTEAYEQALSKLEKTLVVRLGRGNETRELANWLVERSEFLDDFFEWYKSDDFRMKQTEYWHGGSVPSVKLKLDTTFAKWQAEQEDAAPVQGPRKRLG